MGTSTTFQGWAGHLSLDEIPSVREAAGKSSDVRYFPRGPCECEHVHICVHTSTRAGERVPLGVCARVHLGHTNPRFLMISLVFILTSIS